MAFIERKRDRDSIAALLQIFPVTAIVGPRQVGKTTLALTFRPDHIFDLENPRDLALFENAQLTLENLTGLIMIDEVQRKPAFFSLLRYLVDRNPSQRYLILGSASADLHKQSGESLAGRIGYFSLSGLNIQEVGQEKREMLWIRGGFPKSFLSDDDNQSMIWRTHFISTFLERDLNILGIDIPPATMYRFWIMLSHYHCRILNYSEIGRSFGVSDKTVKRYIAILESTFMVRVLMPWHVSIGKRLVKSPKLYLRDSGIFHALQSIETYADLRSHPKLGSSWEGFAFEELIATIGKRDNEVYFYAAHSGVELDLFWQHKGKNYGAEFKYTDAPSTTKSMHQAIEDLALDHLWVVYPGDKAYRLTDKITVVPLKDLTEHIFL